MTARRELIARIRTALAGPDRSAALASLADLPPRTRLGALFSLLLDKDALTRWRTVTAFGATMADLAAERPEEARDVWHNLMWRVNEESGNIGWGIPECMGETLAACPAMAEAYHRILLSYVQEMEGDCTFIDHAPLRRGAWWALARLAQAAPVLAAPALKELAAALGDCDPEARGLACLALARIKPDPARPLLETLAALQADEAAFDVFDGWDIIPTSVAAEAHAALEALRRCG